MSDSLRDRIAEAIHREDTPEQNADAIIAEFGLAVDRRAVSRIDPAFGGQPAYYNPDAAKNGDSTGAYIATLPVEFRVLGEWKPEATE